MITFGVDDVAPASEALPTQPLGDTLAEALLIGGDAALPVLEPDGVHPLLSAVARAFADHRPLVLSPDVVWLTIAQGIAQHVRLNAEALRHRLVTHTGRKRLAVVVDGPTPLADVVGEFHKLLGAEIADPGLFDCDFTTSTDVERVAGQVVLLDAYSSYFSLWMVCVCGIPSITLTGTPADWRKIRERVDALDGFGLETWGRSLAPIADQFVRAASGDLDIAFWQRIYNPYDAYGGSRLTGWIGRLFPYLLADGVQNQPNPLLDLPIDEPRDLPGAGAFGGPGITTDAVPATLSRVTITVNDRVHGENSVVALHAGVVAVAQDADGALRPIAGWHVAPAQAEIEEVIDRIHRDHVTTPPQPARMLFYAPGEVIALLQQLGSATLFDGAWQILPRAEHRDVWRGEDQPMIYLPIDLADGRSIGAVLNEVTGTADWIIGRFEDFDDGGSHRQCRLLDDPADVPVLGRSLALLLQTALDSGGDIAHLEVGRLADLDAATG